MSSKSIVFANQNDNSFKSNRSFLSYNINDFLPPTTAVNSRTTSFAFKSKDKIYTQPNDRTTTVQLNEFKKRMDMNEQQKQNLRKQLELLANALRSKEQVINQKNELIKELTGSVNNLQQQLKDIKEIRPNLGYSRNNIHFIHFPKFTQKYQVSVQTDAIEVTSSHPPPTFTKKTVSKIADKDLHEIQQKLSKLNPVKKSFRQKLAKQSDVPTRAKKNDVLLGKTEEKQNMMRLSNTFQRVGEIGEQKTREQTIQILPIDSDQIQRLIRLYME